MLSKNNELKIFRGDILLVNIPQYKEDGKRRSVQNGTRPCIVISNDLNNKYSSVITVVPFTSQIKNHLPTHVYLDKNIYKLNKNSTILCEQVFTMDKVDIIKKYNTKIDEVKMKEIEKALQIQQGMTTNITEDKNIINKIQKEAKFEAEQKLNEYKNNLLEKLKNLGIDKNMLKELMTNDEETKVATM